MDEPHSTQPSARNMLLRFVATAANTLGLIGGLLAGVLLCVLGVVFLDSHVPSDQRAGYGMFVAAGCALLTARPIRPARCRWGRGTGTGGHPGNRTAPS